MTPRWLLRKPRRNLVQDLRWLRFCVGSGPVNQIPVETLPVLSQRQDIQIPGSDKSGLASRHLSFPGKGGRKTVGGDMSVRIQARADESQGNAGAKTKAQEIAVEDKLRLGFWFLGRNGNATTKMWVRNPTHVGDVGRREAKTKRMRIDSGNPSGTICGIVLIGNIVRSPLGICLIRNISLGIISSETFIRKFQEKSCEKFS